MTNSVALPQKSLFNRLVFALFMASITTSVVVLVVVFSQIGFSQQLFSVWLSIFKVDYPIIVTTIVLFGQPLQARLFRFVPGEMKPTKRSRIVFALVMASVTVSIAIFSGLWIRLGLTLETAERFVRIFPFAYVTAIPFILFIAPRLQQAIDVMLPAPAVRQTCCD